MGPTVRDIGLVGTIVSVRTSPSPSVCVGAVKTPHSAAVIETSERQAPALTDIAALGVPGAPRNPSVDKTLSPGHQRNPE
jgi:hypothetical protein